MSGPALTLRGKLTAMTLATIVALTVLFAFLLYHGKQRMMEDRQDKVRNLVEVVLSTLGKYEADARAGKISEDEAKQQVLAVVNAMR
ncbi:MAG: cache domain-containing protein, partial [Azonexus sp.]